MSALADLPPLRQSLEAHGLMADKGLGQHFLLDLNITRKIARLAGPLEGVRVIEVGPGPGGLTRALLEAGAHVIAIEKDARFLPLLNDLRDVADDRLQIELADALKADEATLTGGAPVAIVSNLPYNVGTALLIKWLTGPYRPASMTLMFQKEVAQRIVARPGDDAYGRLAIIAQATSQAKIVMEAPARAFTPPPKVDSAVVRLDPLDQRPPEALIAALERVSQAAFGQRRKMLRSSLKVLGGAALCDAAGIDPARRAETLSLEEFMGLAEALRRAEGAN
ncbi:16S rRNA (adenine(1518)-N(6)/adenine(1519)-N(6))-dimethyltransferase RsmA [Phenylobacterium sp.]|jgi:16S rRNA (adenine1518-N6/adenine1519-N6)-dimethyltransferase|uniref:16S rRNA (adenine(1518)-N(6)/adenine(1519)-N(6))- dimethyltransferase RsmA n=1 Tax=Phenylobacterium sp. TaxID=1871053 RepID=UPI000C8CAFB6|nr:16S rRNA (adenine(1518)-N(6)/adenine(1519)-N(6))-dimethyltransferase RsmA [Phenylobacterium sp.]MAK81682.1 16S rRNA (adenine(1518)-N(6)/adenine(1519)-N(6))-dimethyltransferase [Phenylobacterium sp.]|tara:strand:+ start:62193 stop:63032 length:840 start_codon:yes stop_codon:yes gene_type:complete